ncbi:extracellular solute-binding protein [Heliorestis acidaminivorans]|uniref:Extracellular solute-binding protein n=1 Tax=Heliorestis acidaminivorans TaxID=553427 RepID=A0A6I0EZJ9_9FIRM|nr:extracellular solute-binding protein [Heliorestis acidaminivorans]KAB2951168.1 extracellular solute-binding protein [Heliorestis acidaminivorans]
MKKSLGKVLATAFLGTALLVSGCSSSQPATTTGSDALEETKELVIYSARNERFVQPLLDSFAEETGIEVKLLSAGESSVNRIMEEKNNVQADVFFSNDTGAMEYLRLEGLLQGNTSQALNIIDPMYRAEDGSWVGLSARTRVLMYNKDLISEEEIPKTLWELTDPKWAGEFMITRGGNSSMVAHIAALRAEWGDEKTKEWIEKVRGNAGAVVNGHGDVRRSVGAGEFKFGLVNNYYFHQQLSEDKDNNVGAIYPDQGADGMGAFVNAAGVALIKGAPNEANARKFIDWILEAEQQKFFAYESMEVPLNPAVEANPIAMRIDEYKVMDMPLQELGPVWVDVKKLIEEAGLDLDL